jgi:uncharacterized membrane protein YphA (DoxX/SURF4 family)
LDNRAAGQSSVKVRYVNTKGQPLATTKTTYGFPSDGTVTPTAPVGVAPASIDGYHVLTATAAQALWSGSGTSTILDGTASGVTIPYPAEGTTTDVYYVYAAGPAVPSAPTMDNSHVSGTGEPGATVTVDVDGGPGAGGFSATTVVGDDGTWSITVPGGGTLPDGSHTVQITQSDPAPSTVSSSSTNTLTVDTTPPALSPNDLGLTNDPTPTISGRGEIGATVVVTVNGKDYSTPVTDDGSGQGVWSVTIPDSNALADGSYPVKIVASDAAGNKTTSASQTIAIDATVPGKATAVVSNGTTVTGAGEPGASVTVNDADGHPVGTATVGDDGKFSVTLSPAAQDGDKLSVIVSGVLMVVGSLSIILGVWGDLGALMILVAVLPIAFLMHQFWKADGEARMNEQIQFNKTLSLAGGALALFALFALVPELGLTITGPLL